MENLKHIFFDLDHTLWDFDKNASEALTELYHELSLDEEIQNLDAFIRTYREINADYWHRYNYGKVTKAELRTRRFQDTLNRFGVSDVNEKAKVFGELYIQRCPHKRNIFPDAHETLGYLRSKYKLHIITNGFKEVQFIKLNNNNLTPYFDLILCSEEVGVNKPNPLVFETAMQRTNASANESLMIGDNPDTDIRGAQNCEMHTILFNPEAKNTTVDSLEIKGLKELVSIL